MLQVSRNLYLVNTIMQFELKIEQPCVRRASMAIRIDGLTISVLDIMPSATIRGSNIYQNSAVKRCRRLIIITGHLKVTLDSGIQKM